MHTILKTQRDSHKICNNILLIRMSVLKKLQNKTANTERAVNSQSKTVVSLEKTCQKQ